MKTVLLLGGPADGQRAEVHGPMRSVLADHDTVMYDVVPMCSHGDVHWFGVLDGADPLALLIAGYGACDESLRRAVKTIEVLEAVRPHWAMGFTSDSVAAQSMQGSLSALWSMLGAKNQTEAVSKLSVLTASAKPRSRSGGGVDDPTPKSSLLNQADRLERTVDNIGDTPLRHALNQRAVEIRLLARDGNLDCMNGGA